MRTVRRLRLRYLVFMSSLTSCPLLYYLPCRNQVHPHHNQSVSPLTQSTVHSAASPVDSQQSLRKSLILCHIQTPYGGDGGIRTPVQNTFRVASYNYKIIYLVQPFRQNTLERTSNQMISNTCG